MKLNIQLFASGTIEFPQAGSSWRTIQGKIEYYESNSSIENNTSNVNTKLYVKVGTGGTSGRGWAGNVTVNGKEHSWTRLDSELTVKGSYVLVKEFNDTIQHNADGSKSIAISGSISGPSGTSISGVTSSGSRNVALSTIPRASEITATNADIGSSSIIVINKKNDSFTTTLKYKFASQTTYTTIVDKTSEKTYGWQIPTSFYALIPNSRYGSCSIQAITYNGNEQVGDAKYVNINIFANETLCRPTISDTSIIDTNEKSVGLTGDNTKFVRYVSTPKLTWNASAKNSATLKSQTINNVNATSPYQSNWAESFKLNVVDTREYSNTYNFTFPNVVNYFYPQVNAYGRRETAISSKVLLTITGKFFKGNFSDTNPNTLTVECKYKKKEDTEWTTVLLEPTINDDGSFSMSDLDMGEICDYQHNWQFSVSVTDKIATQSSNFYITVGEPLWSGYKKDGSNTFKLNGKLLFKESGYGDKFTIEPRFSGADDQNYLAIRAAVGDAGTDPDTYNIATVTAKSGNAWLKGDINLGGYAKVNGEILPSYEGWCLDANNALREGRYWCGNETTNLPGNHPWGYLRVRVSNGSVVNHTDNWGWQEFFSTNGRNWIRYIVNTNNWSPWKEIVSEDYVKNQDTIWQGNLQMGANDTINLSKGISSQKTGIVLIFSGYSNGAAQNNNHTSYFIPRRYVGLYAGGGVVIPVGEAGRVNGAKYIYVYDDRLVGNANNTSDNNNKWVLTAVVGV